MTKTPFQRALSRRLVIIAGTAGLLLQTPAAGAAAGALAKIDHCESSLLDERVTMVTEVDTAQDSVRLVFSVEGREDLKAVAYLLKGNLTFNLKLKDEDSSARALTGREVVRTAFATFGDRVREITGVWCEGDNLDTFNWLTGQGWSAEEAALETWTGRTAALYGFSHPEIKVTDGEPGDFLGVMVTFRRTPPPSKVRRGFRLIYWTKPVPAVN